MGEVEQKDNRTYQGLDPRAALRFFVGLFFQYTFPYCWCKIQADLHCSGQSRQCRFYNASPMPRMNNKKGGYVVVGLKQLMEVV